MKEAGHLPTPASSLSTEGLGLPERQSLETEGNRASGPRLPDVPPDQPQDPLTSPV
jgi:hypothetical protein